MGGRFAPSGYRRRKATRTIVLAATLALAANAEAHARPPVRAGTLMVAYRPPWALEATPSGCRGSFECFAWLQACRKPAPSVGLSSSIVDVRGLAGARKTRTFRVLNRQDALSLSTGVAVELWDQSCQKIHLPDGELDNVWRARFKIPRDARWMTVANGTPAWGPGGSYAGVALKWALR